MKQNKLPFLYLFFCVALFFFTMNFVVFAQSVSSQSSAVSASDILGSWKMNGSNGEADGIVIEIFEKNGTYNGYGYSPIDLSLIEQATEPIYDVKNPDPALRHRLITEIVFVTFLEFREKDWANGEIYNPSGGQYFYARAKLSQDKQKLTIRASVDKSGIFGLDIVLTRLHNSKAYEPYKLSIEARNELLIQRYKK